MKLTQEREREREGIKSIKTNPISLCVCNCMRREILIFIDIIHSEFTAPAEPWVEESIRNLFGKCE